MIIIKCKCGHEFGTRKDPYNKIQKDRPNCSICLSDIHWRKK